MRRGRTEWAALINEFEASSETQVAFCKRKGLVVGSFRGWRYRLQREAAPEVTVPNRTGSRSAERAALSIAPRRSDATGTNGVGRTYQRV